MNNNNNNENKGRKDFMEPSTVHLLKLLEKDWRYYYTPRSKEIVYKRFRVDFQLFGYDTDIKFQGFKD